MRRPLRAFSEVAPEQRPAAERAHSGTHRNLANDDRGRGSVQKGAAWTLAVAWALALGFFAVVTWSEFTEPEYSWANGWMYRFTRLNIAQINALRMAVAAAIPLLLLGYGSVAGESWTAPRTWRPLRMTGATFGIAAAWIAIGVAAGALQPLACGRESPAHGFTDARLMCGWRVDLYVLVLHGVLGVAFVGLVKRSFGRVADWDAGRLIVFSMVTIWAAWPWLSMAIPFWWVAFGERSARGVLHTAMPSRVPGRTLIWGLIIGLEILAGYWLARNRPGLHVAYAAAAVAVGGPLIAILALVDSASGTMVVLNAFPPLVLLGLLAGAALVKLSRRGAPTG